MCLSNLLSNRLIRSWTSPNPSQWNLWKSGPSTWATDMPWSWVACVKSMPRLGGCCHRRLTLQVIEFAVCEQVALCRLARIVANQIAVVQDWKVVLDHLFSFFDKENKSIKISLMTEHCLSCFIITLCIGTLENKGFAKCKLRFFTCFRTSKTTKN